MRQAMRYGGLVVLGCLGLAPALLSLTHAQQGSTNNPNEKATTPTRGASSYSQVVITESFDSIRTRMAKAKPEVMHRQKTLLEQRYDLADRPAKTVNQSDRNIP